MPVFSGNRSGRIALAATGIWVRHDGEDTLFNELPRKPVPVLAMEHLPRVTMEDAIKMPHQNFNEATHNLNRRNVLADCRNGPRRRHFHSV